MKVDNLKHSPCYLFGITSASFILDITCKQELSGELACRLAFMKNRCKTSSLMQHISNNDNRPLALYLGQFVFASDQRKLGTKHKARQNMAKKFRSARKFSCLV